MKRLYKLLLVAAFLPACGKSGDSGSPTDSQPWIGQPAPEFSLERYAGDTETGEVVSLRDFRGRFVVLHFATSW